MARAITRAGEEFVRSFLIPRGATVAPPKATSIYAGRLSGSPALFIFGPYNPVIVRDWKYGVPGQTDAWFVVTESEVDVTAKPLRELVVSILDELGFSHQPSHWTAYEVNDRTQRFEWFVQPF